MRALSRDQRRLALVVGGWQLVEALLSDHPNLTEYGGSSCGDRVGEQGDWIEHDRTRIVVGPAGSLRKWKTDARISVTWAAIRAHGKRLPPPLIDELRANRAETHRHNIAALAGWHYSHAMDLAERWAMDAWVAGHCQTMRRLRSERAALLRQALPVDDEPTDLLELLALAGAA